VEDEMKLILEVYFLKVNGHFYLSSNKKTVFFSSESKQQYKNKTNINYSKHEGATPPQFLALYPQV
jgi:hypothetical protein